jgi:intracellular sulfur oxidation DsrE/DsrF family protein
MDKTTDRRSIIGAGALLAGAGTVAGAARAQSASATDGAWQPTMEPQDAWLDRSGTRHRLVIDTTTAKIAGGAIGYADNFYSANLSGYGIKPEAIGLVIVFRHLSTPFGFNDAIWAKYGAVIVKKLPLEGDEAVRGTRGNPLLSAPAKPATAKPSGDAKAKPGPAKPGADGGPATLASLRAKGAQFAVCGMATQGLSHIIASETGGDAGAIEKELKANLIPGGIIVPAGVVAVNRAQERGYAILVIPE